MREHAVNALGVCDADELEHLYGALLDLVLVQLGIVQRDDLLDLEAAAEHGVQAGHGLLEDHRDAVAAYFHHLAGRGVDDVVGLAVAHVEPYLAAHGLALGALKELHEGEAGDALAAAGLADYADGGAAGNIEADAVDGLDRTDVGEEVAAHVVELDDVIVVAHRGHVLRGICRLVRPLLFEPARESAVEAGYLAGLLARNVGCVLAF